MFYLLKVKKYPANVSNTTESVKKQIIFLMSPNIEGWHYIAVTTLSALIRGITSKHTGDLYCLNCLHSYRTKTNLNQIKKNE